jgi:hypothetical protein
MYRFVESHDVGNTNVESQIVESQIVDITNVQTPKSKCRKNKFKHKLKMSNSFDSFSNGLVVNRR